MSTYVYAIPCSLLDLNGLEQFFEEKAKNGRLLKRLSLRGMNGKFEEVLEEDYHFCVDVYRKMLKESDLGSPEFIEYIDECSELGWTYDCVFGNLVIFYKKGGERPPELKRNQIAVRHYLSEWTVRVEQKMFLWRLLANLLVLSVWLAGIGVIFWRGSREMEIAIWMILLGYLIMMPLTNLSPVLANYIQQTRIAKRIRLNLPLPDGKPFWSYQVITCTVSMLTGMWMSFWCYQTFAIKSAMLSFWGVALSVAFMGVSRWFYKTGRRFRFPRLLDLSSIFPLILLTLAVLCYPRAGAYRFQIMPGDRHVNQTSEEQTIIDLGINLKEIGLGGKEFGFYHENKNPYCSSERIIYQVEAFPSSDYGGSEYSKVIRYAGTVIAQLKNHKSLTSYLKQKKMSLNQAEELYIADGIDSYYMEDGQEIVSIKGDQVVIFFLNQYDNRQFIIDDGDVNAVYRNTLLEIME